jgi:hypothetical protein
MPSKITIRDRGFKRFAANIHKAAKQPRAVTVGVHADAGSEPNGASVLQIAAYHEFGFSPNPVRSFIRGWVEEKRDEIAKVVRRFAEVAIKTDAGSALAKMGSLFVASIQRRMASGIGPPLQPATIKRKGSSRQLIDTGTLRASITYKVD